MAAAVPAAAGGAFKDCDSCTGSSSPDFDSHGFFFFRVYKLTNNSSIYQSLSINIIKTKTDQIESGEETHNAVFVQAERDSYYNLLAVLSVSLSPSPTLQF